MLHWIQGAAILRLMRQCRKPNRLRHWRIVEKAKFGGIFANNCDSDVSNPRRTGYIKYHWTDIGCSNVHALMTLAVYVTGV